MAQSPSLPPAIDEKHRDRGDQRPAKDQDPEAQASRRHSDSRSRSARLSTGKGAWSLRGHQVPQKIRYAHIFLIFSLCYIVRAAAVKKALR